MVSSKRRWERAHSRDRAFERYGIVMDQATRVSLVLAIQNGRSRCVRKTSLTRTVHDVRVEDQLVRVVYDRSRKEIVTFLPPPQPKETHAHRV